MKILVTGGSGVIGSAVVPRLLSSGHRVRLLSRHADDDVRQWEGVEPFRGDVSAAGSIRGAAATCDAVLHIAGIAQENPPHATFESVNVGGTRNIVKEAGEAGAKRFVFVSSLGADTGTSAYHQSKFEAERIVETSGLTWTIIRPGNVYGPGDEVISTILKMVRALPAVPVIDSGDQPFQPIWYEDLAAILAAAIDRDDLAHRIFEAAGRETTSMNDVIRRFAEITGREPVRVPIPHALAQLVARVASTAVTLPIDDNKLTMLREQNIVDSTNAADVLRIETTPLDRGLRILADALPETLPDEGVGAMEHKRFWSDIQTSRTPDEVMEVFRNRVADLMPIEFAAEPGVPERVEAGATMTAAIPLRGNIQVRVEVVEPAHVVFATVEGHPLSGIVEFTAARAGEGRVRFAIDIYARASNAFDWLAMKTVGSTQQTANWREVIERIQVACEGSSDGIEEERETLSDDRAAAVEERVREMVNRRKREE